MESWPSDGARFPVGNCFLTKEASRQPLRDCISTISFGATVVGKMHTAGLKGEPLRRSNPKSERNGCKLWIARLKA